MFFELVSQVSGVTHWPLVVSLFIFKEQIYVRIVNVCTSIGLGMVCGMMIGGGGGGGGGGDFFFFFRSFEEI